MAKVDLAGKRVLVVGAESDLGRTIAMHLAEAGATVAAVGTVADADTTFAIQRLSRKLGGPGQAIDATNDMAVRVMVRQVSKALGGFDAIVCALPDAAPLITTHGGKELTRSGGKHLVYIGERPTNLEFPDKAPTWLSVTITGSADPTATAQEVAYTISGHKALA